MSTEDVVSLTCWAKINLALSVGRVDTSGLHRIASWMVAIQFGDALRLERAAGTSSEFTIEFDPDGPVVSVVDWPLDRDLSYQAHTLLQNHLGRQLPVRLSIRKMIPTGSGMGGGSSNAAATLIGLDRLFNLKQNVQTLISLGCRLGSDVAFHVCAILGDPSALVLSYGESIEPIGIDRAIDLVLIMPPCQCGTAQVYHQFDTLTHQPPVVPNVADVRALAAQSKLSPDGPFNDLTEAACAVQPQLADWRETIQQELGSPVHLTGSGSAMFIVAANAKAANQMAQAAQAHSYLSALATRSLTTSTLSEQRT